MFISSYSVSIPAEYRKESVPMQRSLVISSFATLYIRTPAAALKLLGHYSSKSLSYGSSQSTAESLKFLNVICNL